MKLSQRVPSHFRGKCATPEDRRRTESTRRHAETSAGIVVNDDDVLVDPGAPFRVELATSRHHRLVVVEGKTELVLLDADGKPIRDRRCRVVVDGRTRQSLTDHGGQLTVHHLRNAEVFGVEFPGLDEGGAG